MVQVQTDIEKQIIRIAKDTFVKSGYSETSMSEIAQKAGISRTVLNYYFRSKERLFAAIIGDVAHDFFPELQTIVETSPTLRSCLNRVIDAYYNVLKANPCLPMFMLREMHRDPRAFYELMCELKVNIVVSQIQAALLHRMDDGTMRRLPLEHVFRAFYGLVMTPFLTRPITDMIFRHADKATEEDLSAWKEQVVALLYGMLKPENEEVTQKTPKS